jgi:hypothetical protein
MRPGAGAAAAPAATGTDACSDASASGSACPRLTSGAVRLKDPSL